MARPRPPVWLSAPSRFAGLSQPRARTGLLVLAGFLALCLTALLAPRPPFVDPNVADEPSSVLLYESIVAGVRGGGDYYSVTAQSLRRGDYPLKPFVTFRLPTLAVVQGALPPVFSIVMLYGLIASVVAAWFVRLRAALPRRGPLLIALLLLAGGLIAFMQPMLIFVHEIWAGLLMALALAVRRPGGWIEAVAIGLMAMLVRETAALFVMIMAGAALMEGHRREAIGWAASLGVLAIVVVLHAVAVAQVVGPLDAGSPGWGGMLSLGYFVQTMSVSTALSIAPAWASALLVGLAMFGWASWRTPLARRALLIFAGYAVLLSLFGRIDTFYWGLLIAPTLLIGLAFVPDGLRDLVISAVDSRRIIVTRSVR